MKTLALALTNSEVEFSIEIPTGFFLESFESALPNGFHYSGAKGSTFLDGVYCENLSTYFVLDALQVFIDERRICSVALCLLDYVAHARNIFLLGERHF